MSDIAARVKEARIGMQDALKEAAKLQKELEDLQSECPHDKRHFVYQFNAFHETMWNVTHRCIDCGVDITRRQEPICPTCNEPLKRARKGDIAAEEERQKPEHGGRMNPPLAFRCTGQGEHIVILYHLGD